MRAGKICNQPGCADLIPQGSNYCEAHRITKLVTWENDKWIPGWDGIRLRVLRKARRRCAICGRKANIVDHLLPQAWGGTENLVNLRAMCYRCHLAKTQHESRLGHDLARIPPANRIPLIADFLEVWR